MSTPSLLELQQSFRAALLGGDARFIEALVADDGLPPSERLDVYRNNVGASLTASLQGIFPVVCRLVDERFFAYAAREFVWAHPPGAPCLVEYGAGFPAFLAAFPPCRELHYLADVARLEWSLHGAANAAQMDGLSAADLQVVPPPVAPRLIFKFAPSLAYIASPWPIDRIWRANRPGARAETIDLDAGGVQLEVRRHAGEVEMRQLPLSLFAFRRALASGQPLAAAIEAAFAVDDMFAVSPALAGLVADRALAGLRIEGEEE